MTDAAARAEALDPHDSFIVQAPAGSGKTELLIQRYLALLATVDEPEQILAITFTRKAAAEMRRRVGAALRDAENDDAVEPHRAATRELARRALARNAERGWALTEYAGRMRIETLDALNARLAGQLPTLSGGVGGLPITEDAERDYRRAAERTVRELLDGGELAPVVRRLLRHFDYSAVRLETLIAQLLPRREQWLRRLAARDAGLLRRNLEAALERMVSEAIERAVGALPRDLAAPLLELAGQAAARCGAATDLTAATDPTRPLHERLAAWRAFASIVLTGQDTWRQRLDRRVGFGPEFAAERARMMALMTALAPDESLRDAIAEVRRLPDPHYSEAEWRVLDDLRAVLLRAAAELRVSFAEERCADFVELGLAAQQALGSSASPTELLLTLDHHIRHILVDEFQDTSHAQMRLLETLTAGWMPGDGRTLFLVGDPMQSIYRFRDADMSLFLRVRRDGLGSVRCRALTLERNFRSDPAIVEWINDAFVAAFPARDDLGRGAVRYSPSRATRVAEGHAVVRSCVVESAEEAAEIDAVLEIVAAERRQHPDASLAVLVQSRPHLAGLHRRLRAQGHTVGAVEIDPLNERQALQDLIALTRALLHPADHLAWLAVLRAPWCGLRWRDLHVLRADGASSPIVPALLNQADTLAAMSADGRERAERFAAHVQAANARRGAMPLPEWVEDVWRSLGGPQTLTGDEDRRSVERFFVTLRRLARSGDLDDPASLDDVFAGERSEPPQSARPDVEIMTIHRAKGLEFDTVILLGLARAPRPAEQKALYWMERVSEDGHLDLLIAPWAPAGGEPDRLAALIRGADDARDQAERLRLLYVAATRARLRLHLVARIAPPCEAPPARSLLAPIWPRLREASSRGVSGRDAMPVDGRALPDDGRVPPDDGSALPDDGGALPDDGSALPDDGTTSADDDSPASFTPRLRRFVECIAPPEAVADAPSHTPRPEFDWAGLPAVQIGTVVHRWLHQLSLSGPHAWSVAALDAAQPTFRNELELLGLAEADAAAAAATVTTALKAVLEDPLGHWLLGPRDGAASEHALTARSGHVLEHLRLDRTFVAGGFRWIVDYKTGSHEGADLDTFLDSEVDRYRAQLERYAAAWRELDSRPIRVGLYFPLLGAFRWWTPGDTQVFDEAAIEPFVHATRDAPSALAP